VRGQATPAAYESGHTEQFWHIHFVAHGTANRLSPFDSAIFMSKDTDNSESFKLYTQNKQLPVHADLSRFPPGYSTGERFYASEGPVGLAWVFLRAGAHAVIADSWGATDASTQQFMDSFYDS
jgi:CHAT domain-containing protein